MAFNEAEVTDAVMWGGSFLQTCVKPKGKHLQRSCKSNSYLTLTASGMSAKKKGDIQMTRNAGLFAVSVLAVFSLMVAGCGDKAKDGAQVPASTPTKVNMQEGQWEITTTIEMPGMPKPLIMTTTTCLTQKNREAKGVR